MESENIQEIITCGVCLESFNEVQKCPRMLSCGHSFCHSCLEKLLTLSPSCPTCKTQILSTTTDSIPVNYSLKSLINIRSHRSMSNTFENILQDEHKCESFSSNHKPRTSSRKYLSEGFCTEHDNLNELRCMDCEVWICGLCGMLHHRHCRTLVVAEAYKELKKQFSQKVEKELCERKSVSERLNESLRLLDEERKSLIEEIKRKELELKVREYRIKELESLTAEEEKFCDKLKRLQEMAETSANDAEFSKTVDELDKLLEEGKKKIPKHLLNLHLPETLEALETLCQNGPVYAVEDRYDGTRYGKVAVKDGKIWVYSFQPEKPHAKLFIFKDLRYRFSESSELPVTGFLQLTPEGDSGADEFDVVIKTEGHPPRTNNFILLCSGLKGSSYKRLTMNGFYDCYQISQGPPPVLEGIRGDDCKIPVEEAGVYGMWGRNSWFRIQLKDLPSFSLPKFGVAVAGFQDLKDRQGSFLITECGLVI